MTVDPSRPVVITESPESHAADAAIVMGTVRGGTDEADFSIAIVDPHERADIKRAIALGDSARATVGLLPRAVYLDAVERRCLLVARNHDGEVVGYALFRLTRNAVRLTHLVVDPLFRGRGIARRLVEAVSTLHGDRAGIGVWCRLDYGLAAMWSSLGFERGGERKGRGRNPGTLVSWWRDHGQPTLFARSNPVEVRASVDMNIVRDLVDASRRDSAESSALLNDDLIDRLELVRTPELDLEIDGTASTSRSKCAQFASNLQEIRPERQATSQIHQELLGLAFARNPSFAQSDRGQHDLKYVAEAIASGLQVFITRDQELIDCIGDQVLNRNLRILRPAEAIVRVDELERAEAYRPASLEATPFSIQLLGSGESGALDALFTGRAGERRTEFADRVRRLTFEGFDRLAVRGPSGTVEAGLLKKIEGGCVQVAFARVRDGGLAATLARQLLRVLRIDALAASASAIRVTDLRASREFEVAAHEDGFTREGSALVGLVVDTIGTAIDVGEAAASAARGAGAAPPSRHRDLTVLAAAERERSWWPAKVLGAGIRTFLVPIRQEYSRELLGRPAGLFGRPEGLGLSREHIYYRSPRGPRLTAPARILWYMSETSPSSIEAAGVIAASQLDEVVIGRPEELFDRFRHLGVWQAEQVSKVASGGVVQALRFVGTEVFSSTIGAARVRSLVGHAPQGPVKVAEATFAELYALGRAASQ
jgi:ribosomal protein S18 acetylase RimI-like enzyme